MGIGMERVVISIFAIVAVLVFLIVFFRQVLHLVIGHYAMAAINASRTDQPTGNQRLEARQVQSQDPFHRGLDPSVITNLPVYVYKQTDQIDENGTRECVVCLRCFEDEEIAMVLPNCKHLFHAQCINMWLKSHSTCPICSSTCLRVGHLINSSQMHTRKKMDAHAKQSNYCTPNSVKACNNGRADRREKNLLSKRPVFNSS
ncbi:RING-H2 finger protein ATL39-like [Macadamia integrifolia]|uniref:RING-H2 finger protein ATL39-like n=1 Tax=Macadamia integrifolia TaxID=60698 RepID=UPI001C4F6983|nr:RING-H2 finger protein ATL39-like [Macadamia integrifolia]